MLPIYLDISDVAKQKINHNVWCMFELLEVTCEGLSYEEILDSIFPPYILQNNLDKCVSVRICRVLLSFLFVVCYDGGHSGLADGES